MKQRCALAKFVCRAKLPSQRLAFTLKSASRDYELPDNELKNLDKKEGYRPGKPYDQSQYIREDHYVWREGDAKRPLLVAIYRGHPELDPPLPSDDYKELINGAKHWNLPAEYIRQLESIQTEA